jgi:site-specific DNA recombinase
MSPTHARKAGVKYRYYLSSALLNGAAERAGSVARVPAAEIEAVVVKSVRVHVRSQRAIDDRILIETHVVRVEVHTDHLIIKLVQAEPENDDTGSETVLSVPWQKMASRRRREILIPEGPSPQQVCRIRSENRATLVASIARSRRWLNDLITDSAASAESIAKRELTKHLKEGDHIRIAGLGTLQVRNRAARIGRNPATGEQIVINASKKIAFRASKELNEAVLDGQLGGD